jgi:hypothetical protein
MMNLMVRALRADAVRRDLTALAGAGLGVDEFQAAAADVVRRAVPYDATCWATVDPQTNMLTGSITLHFDPSPDVEARFAETEAEGSDLHSFHQIIGRPSPVARLSDAGLARRSRQVLASPRSIGRSASATSCAERLTLMEAAGAWPGFSETPAAAISATTKSPSSSRPPR